MILGLFGRGHRRNNRTRRFVEDEGEPSGGRMVREEIVVPFATYRLPDNRSNSMRRHDIAA